MIPKIFLYSILDALKTIFKEEGIKGLYKGLVPALILTSHGAIQFSIYEALKKWTSSLSNDKTGNSQPPWVSMLIGSSSKVIAATVTYPYQLIKSRLQQRQMSASILQTREYRSTTDCFIQIMKHEGIRGFFRGVIPNAAKVAPSAAVTFCVYEESMKIFRK